MVQRGKEWGKVVGKVVYSLNLGLGSKRKEGCGGLEQESRTWFNEERRGGK